MKTITENEKFGFPETFAIILFLFLLIASHVFAIHSPAMAQSNPATQSNSKEGKGDQPEPKKVKPLGPADEFNFPTSTTYLSQEDSQPLVVNLGGKLSVDRESAESR
jgi:hypothetical protein